MRQSGNVHDERQSFAASGRQLMSACGCEGQTRAKTGSVAVMDPPTPNLRAWHRGGASRLPACAPIVRNVRATPDDVRNSIHAG